MKDEKMAEEYAQNLEKELMKEYEEHLEYGQTPYLATIPIPHAKEAFLAGLKAGRPQWHDLEKDPTDLPKDKHNVLCKWLDQCVVGWYDKDTNTWTLIYRDYHLHCIEAWCEIPTFDKESEIRSDMFPEIILPEGSAEFVEKIIADAEKRLKESK